MEESADRKVWSEEEKEKDDVIRLLVEEFGDARTGLPLIAEQIIINDHVRLFKCLSDKILGDDASAIVESEESASSSVLNSRRTAVGISVFESFLILSFQKNDQSIESLLYVCLDPTPYPMIYPKYFSI